MLNEPAGHMSARRATFLLRSIAVALRDVFFATSRTLLPVVVRLATAALDVFFKEPALSPAAEVRPETGTAGSGLAVFEPEGAPLGCVETLIEAGAVLLREFDEETDLSKLRDPLTTAALFSPTPLDLKSFCFGIGDFKLYLGAAA